MDKDCAVIIVAGGKSTRMGYDKRLLIYDGKPFLEHTIEKAKMLSDEVVLVLNSPIKEDYRVKVVYDEEKDLGPLIGLYSGLLKIKKGHALLLSCDMLLLSVEFLRDLISRADGHDIAIPEYRGVLQPLCTLYSKKVVPCIEQLLKGGKRSLLDLLKENNLSINFVKFTVDSEHDKYGFLFFNVNTQEDYFVLKNLRALSSEP